MFEMDILWIELEKQREKWNETKQALRLQPGAFDEGRMHAYQEVLGNFDNWDNYESDFDVELESQVRELIQKCDDAPTGYTPYGQGFKVGMSECADDLRELVARTVG